LVQCVRCLLYISIILRAEDICRVTGDTLELVHKTPDEAKTS
jgi:hypothetical protein